MAHGSVAPRATAHRAVARFALSAAALGAAGAAMGRGGGGNHAAVTAAPGSGHSGGSSFGRGGGGGSLGGIIVVLIIALVVYFIYKRVTRGGRQVPEALSALGAAAAARAALGSLAPGVALPGVMLPGATGQGAPLQAAVDTIRAQDPGFEMETFLQRAEMTFFLVKRGVQQNDAAAIRPYLNDDTFAQVSRNIALLKSQHQHQLLESLNVRALHLLGAECNAQDQRLQVHFDLVYRAKVLGDANRVVSDEREDTQHGERWTFTRGATAKTPVDGGVTASRCPACGAELRLNLDGTCAHCRASVTNGSVDWVVTQVQSAPFLGYSAHLPQGSVAPTLAEGIANLRAGDPTFALDGFLGRVKTAFLALQDAWCKQNLDAGRAFLSPGAYFSWRAQLETLAAEGRRDVMENIVVRGIGPVRIVHGRVFDDLTVRIDAAAADYEIDQHGNVVFGDRTVRPFTEEWTFQRSVGVATVQKPGTLENTCPSCGAPVALNQIGECRYCKAAVTSGKFDWVVSRIEQDDAGGGTDSLSNRESMLGDVGEDIALRVGGALVGGLLGSLLAGSSSDDSRD
jgi:predicted lipid-binding transport protein (Tim44 family)